MQQMIQMPKLSPTMTDGVIAKWHKQVGDFVDAGDVLFEISTDKATVEHSSLDSGYLREILVAEGESAPVGTNLAILTEAKDEKYTTSTPSKKEEAPKEEIVQPLAAFKEEPTFKERILASPLAKKLAKATGISLETVHGTGPGGRIMSRDLPQMPSQTILQAEVVRIPLSPMRKVIAERLSYAKMNIPHFYLTLPCDVTDLLKMREQLKEEQFTLTITDFIVRAVALSLMGNPLLRSCFDENERVVLQHPYADISIAVSIAGGVVTPVLFKANEKSIQELSKEMKKLTEKARTNKLRPEEYTGGCFTISNLGMFGIDEFQAIINPPQCAILAVGAATDALRMIDGKLEQHKILKLSLSVDHRILDGEVSARFLQSMKKYLEKPALLLLK